MTVNWEDHNTLAVNDHRITITGGVIGPCDCMDFETRKAKHQGWCKHRLIALLLLRQAQPSHPFDVIDMTETLQSRIISAENLLKGVADSDQLTRPSVRTSRTPGVDISL